MFDYEKELDERFPLGRDRSYQFIMEAHWSHWDDAVWIGLFYRNNHYYLVEDRYHAMAASSEPTLFSPELVSEDFALQRLIEIDTYNPEE